MANIVEDFASYRIRAIEVAESEYYETLIRTLDKIERDVIALAKKELPLNYVKRMAVEKSLILQPKYENSIILTADTVVALGRRILPKTTDVKILKFNSLIIKYYRNFSSIF